MVPEPSRERRDEGREWRVPGCARRPVFRPTSLARDAARGEKPSARRGPAPPGSLRRLRAAKPATNASAKAMRDADDEQQAEARGPSGSERAGGRGSRRRWRGRRWRSSGRRARCRERGRLRPARAGRDRLVVAGLELDRVVDGEADQDRQDRDRGHRQRAAEEAEQAEGERRRGEREAERQQPEAGAEDQRAGSAPSTTTATARRTSSASFSARATPSTTTGTPEMT